MKIPRIQRIEEYIMNKDTVSLDELCQVFQISMSTLRRDISKLRQKGTIEKIYGGVSHNSHALLVPFHARSNINASAKQIVSQLAASMVEEDDVIFIDTGSTTCNMIDYLVHLNNVTVITNNLDVIIRALPYFNINVFTLPGMLNRENNSFSSASAEDIFHNYNIKKAFLAAAGIAIDGNVSHSDPWEGPLKHAVMRKADHRYLLVDNRKFDAISLLNYCRIADFESIFTDMRPSENYVNLCKSNKVNLIYPK